MNIIVIGGGAAGFFGAVNAAIQFPEARVIILEKSNKLLAKVRVSGGGRCNVTHDCLADDLLVKNYPRGEKQLRSVFSRFSVKDTIAWFGKRGVELKTEPDGRMFPVSNNSLSIVNCLMEEAERSKVLIKTDVHVKEIVKEGSGFEIKLENGGTIKADRILIATGGNAKETAYEWLRKLGHTIQTPVPSLFTFNLPNDPVTELMGISVDPVRIRVQDTKLECTGPLLITHWGFSGPAALRLSAGGARVLHDMNYALTLRISWLPRFTEEKLRIELDQLRKTNAQKNISSSPCFDLPKRLWEFLVQKGGIGPSLKWAELSNKLLNKLCTVLSGDQYSVKGKTTFKEEFVTCGGISLSEVDLRTMQSKVVPGIFFAGEVLDIDGITGGFNFQAAWSTSWVASQQLGL